MARSARGILLYVTYMKGVILAGGTGSRLMPLTRVTNKHLLPVYNKPMIYYPLTTLIAAGIEDVLIVSGRGHAGHFLDLLGSGADHGVRLSYEVQEQAGGIAQALSLAEDFARGERTAVILGDNIYGDHTDVVRAARLFESQESGGRILLKSVSDPTRFGVATFDHDRITNITEKPSNPASSYCVTGCYFYDESVFSIIRTLVPSGRGELEITDVNNAYIQQGVLCWTEVVGSWTDAGTFDSLLEANNLAAQLHTS